MLKLCLLLAVMAPGDIYTELWKLDQQENGLSVTHRKANGEWNDPSADIYLDEQKPAANNQDLAPLLNKVKPDKLNGETYQTVKALFDNYVPKVGEKEDKLGNNPIEDQEIEKFLDAILKTRVMKACFQYVKDELDSSLTANQFRKEIKHQWFGLYDNYYRKTCDGTRTPRVTRYCSGFEHVFVGEKKGGGIGGYHFWYKYYLDQKQGTVKTHGFNYKGQQGGKNYPWVATFSMSWDVGGGNAKSNPKGFSVGTSPELMIAWGTLGYYEWKAEKRKGDRIPVILGNGAFNLVVYLESLKSCDLMHEVPERGDQIRSLYPEYVSSLQPTPIQSGDVIITQALINAPGDEAGKEWVELKNNSNSTLNFNNWKLCDKQGRCQKFSGSLESGKKLKIICTRATDQHPQLSNSNGKITIRNQANQIATEVTYSGTQDGVVTQFSQ